MVKKVVPRQSLRSPDDIQTGVGKAGWILALIGGIFGVLCSIFILFIGIFFTSLITDTASVTGAEDLQIMGIVFIVLSVYVLLTAIGTIVGAMWMRKKTTQMRGAIIALICGVIGSGGLFGLIGGILGLVDHSQRGE